MDAFCKWLNSNHAHNVGVARQGLNNAAMKHETGRIALQVIDMDKQCDAIYSDQDHYWEHKKLPDAELSMTLSIDHLALPSKFHNHQGYLRDYRG